MKFLIDNMLLIALALVSGGLLLWPVLQRGRAGSVSATEAVRLINREKAVMVDVSDAAEFAAGHAVGSRNIPLSTLEGAKLLPANKALPVILVCATGARSSRAVELLKKAGHDQACSLSGGLRAWRDANLPVDKSA